MKRKKQILSAAIAAAILLLFIVDTQTASTGAADGIDACIKVIIPSLFPFFIVTTYLNASLLGLHLPGLFALGKILHIPENGESLLLLGLIGGYPVGAQVIADAFRQKRLDRRTSEILLGYCSNAGPAFIFGVAGALFSSRWIPFFLWGIHLFSAIITGLLLPRPHHSKLNSTTTSEISIVQALRKSMSICASVCGWVVTFKIIMAYLENWLSGVLKETQMVILTGILELSNGCLKLTAIAGDSVRFILCATFLAAGGVCVMLQTMSVTEPLGLGMYIPGKLMQTSISLLTALPISYILFPSARLSTHAVILIVILSTLVIISVRRFTEKRCGNQETVHV